MRSLKAILTSAGHLKRTLNLDENILSLIALKEVNLPKFTSSDIPLFESITSDLFPGIQIQSRDYSELITVVSDILK